ncbi:glycosyl transferase [Exiguobacterium indicum]|uniref:Glycosyl transferase n=1 Tax=Exiguobacterium indicum TaxID=296995 RepID=A0A0V8GJ56_9BACL|nr:transglycosylase domain-containing protein [Exiguobacterium enclense]KSU50309.1 glycosyl transferase [Exiguobacterium enclense]SDB92317.1 penicillin-binding protein [Exiguobacterium enclense]
MRENWSKFWNHPRTKAVRHWSNITYDVSWNIILFLIIAVLLIGSFSVGAAGGYFASLVKGTKAPPLTEMKQQVNSYAVTSQIYWGSGEKLTNVSTDEERQPVDIKNISPYLLDAVLSTEDTDFYQHDGVVPKATLRAVLQELTNSASRTGGSTLTQQLIKNQILTNEVSFERKAKEIILALRLENAMSKDEILQAYLNVVSFGRNSLGRNIAGIEAASQGVFNKSAKKLTLPQAAFLAGIPKNPYYYTPYLQGGVVKKDLTPSINRMKTVLKRMYVAKNITKEQYEKAIKYDITKDFAKQSKRSRDTYPYVYDLAEREATKIMTKYLMKQDGIKEDEVKPSELAEVRANYQDQALVALRQGGYKVHLTLDKKIHESMQQPAKNNGNFPGSMQYKQVVDPKTKKTVSKQDPEETAAVMVQNETGRILGFVGGRYMDGKADDFNRAFQAKRQIGSTAKPILVYSNGIENGLITPGSTVNDEEYYYQTVPRQPGDRPIKNEGGRYRGNVTVRTALELSLNVPAVKIYEKMNMSNSIQKLVDMGVEVPDAIRYAPSAALGTMEITPVELAGAYATLANYGEFVQPYVISKITKDGKNIYKAKPKKKRIYEPRTAYLTLDMMRGVFTKGTATFAKDRLNVPGDWAGKTGTTNDVKDSYLVGSTPGVTLAVWTGHDQNNSLIGPTTYYQRTQTLWSQMANAAYGANNSYFKSGARFTQPSSVTANDFKNSGRFKEEDKKKKAEEAKKKAEAEKKKEEEAEREEEASRAEEQKQEAQQNEQQAEADAKKKAEEDAKRAADAKAKAEAEAKKKAEADAKKKEADAKKQQEQQKKQDEKKNDAASEN